MPGPPCLLALPTLGSLASGIRHIQYGMAVGVEGSFLRKQLLISPQADRVRSTVTPYTRVHRPAVLAFSQSIRENIGGVLSIYMMA